MNLDVERHNGYREERGTLDLGLSLVCALIQTSLRVGGRAQNWRDKCVTLDLVNCLVMKQYACLGGSMMVGKEYSVLEGR